MTRWTKLVSMLLVLSMVVALIGCGNDNKNEVDNSGSNSNDDGLKGEISMVHFMEEQEPLFKKAIALYQEKNPNVSVKLQFKPYDGYGQYLNTQLVAGTAPDIIFNEWVGDFSEKDLIISYDEYLTQPNPYSSTGKAWRDDFISPYLEMRADARGNLSLLPWSIFNIGTFYNKDMFKEAGITEAPNTWEDWMAANKKLEDKGITPWGVAVKKNDAQFVWLVEGIMRAILRDQYEELNVDHAEGWSYDPYDPASTKGEKLNLEEIWIGYKKGILDAAKSEKLRVVYSLVKDLAGYMNDDAIAIDGDDVYGMFLNQDNAQFINGTWFIGDLNRKMKELKASGNEDKMFDWGMLSIPEVTSETSPLFTAGGQSSKAKVRNGFLVKNQDDQNKIDIAVDFLQFMTSPGVATKLFKLENPDTGYRYVSDFPAIVGVPPIEGTEIPESEYAELNVWLLASAEDEDLFWNHMQKYLSGNMTLDEFLQARSDSFGDALERKIKKAENLNQELIDRELGK